MSTPQDPRPNVDPPPEPDPVSPAAPLTPPPPRPTPPASPDFLDRLDRTLDPEEDDRRTMERLKNPTVRIVIFTLLGLLIGIFGLYATATILRIPIPEPEIMKTFIDAVINLMKMFVP